MTREEVAHVVRAAANVTGETEFVLIGSQALVGQLEFPPRDEVLVRSMELDLYARDNPQSSDEISGVLGFDSDFHRAFGIFADGVGPDTAVLPAGWEERLRPIRLEQMRRRDGAAVTAWALDPNDLLVAKYAAAREKDVEFAEAALRLGLAEAPAVVRGIDEVRNRIGEAKRLMALSSIERALREQQQPG
jgi:hypothetical protein